MRLLFIAMCLSAYAQPWATMIPDSTRAIDWTYSGIPGGIPTSWTQSGATIAAATYSNGASDATSGIQTALNACGENHVVLLGVGTFRINTSLRIPSNCILRGSGAASTILDARGNSYAVVEFGASASPSISNSTGISSGATAGATSFVVADATGINSGTMLLITELNDSAYVSITSNNGTCTWCDGGGGWNGTRVRGQVVEVTNVSGTTITFSPPLYSAYTLTPLATRWTAVAKNAGLENLQIYANNTGYTTNINSEGTAYTWVKGVHGNFCDGDHFRAFYSLRGEVRDSYFHDSYIHAPGNVEGSIFLANKTSGYLVENNILRRQHVALLFNWGAAGNVVAYNYSDGAYDSSATNAILGDMGAHGAHPQYNLLEGNSIIAYYPDSVWATSSHSTLFRNHFRGTTQVCLPYDSRSAPGACHWAFQASRAVQIAYTASYTNLVGNVVGSQEQQDLVNASSNPLENVSSITAPTARSYDGVAYDYTWGYDNLSDGGGAANTPGLSYSTRYLHGDYSRTSGAITWDAGNGARSIPSSFFRAIQPAYWTTPYGTPPWPSTGSDVAGGNVSGVAGHANKLPAQLCYEALAGAFDAATCYAAPPPPTKFRGVMRQGQIK